MATMITSECINCGACEPECPNTAIYQGGVQWQAPDGAMHDALSNDIFYIVPGEVHRVRRFHDHEACAAVCPVDCCVPNPQIPETHEVLLQRARELHPGEPIPDDAPSRFKKAEEAPAAAPAAAAPAGAPVAAAAPAGQPAGIVIQAAPVRVARRPGTGKVEKPIAACCARRRRCSGRAARRVRRDPRVARRAAPARRVGRRALGFTLLSVFQGVLGALPDGASAGSRSGERHALLQRAARDRRERVPEHALYPIVCIGSRSARRGERLHWGIRWWLALGSRSPSSKRCGACARASSAASRSARRRCAWRSTGRSCCRRVDHRVHVRASRRRERRRLRRLLCGPGPLRRQDRARAPLRRSVSLDERDDAYLLRLEFPRVVPPTSLGGQLGLPREMPDYEYDLAVHGRHFVVHGRLGDQQVRKITGVAPAFPPTSRRALRSRARCPASATACAARRSR
jgi:ferredoxin